MLFEEFHKTVSDEFGPLSELQIRQFRQLEELYGDWNAKINVISRKDITELYGHHVLHSLAIAKFLKMHRPDDFPAPGLRFLDLGTGGGFPGIPLAILMPQAEFTLCDSVTKKITVADAVAGSLGLRNVTTVNARAEELDDEFDYIVSRAVTTLDKFLSWVRKKYRKEIIYLKGGDVSEEIAAMMQRFRIPSGGVRTWRIDSWLHDPYYEGKLVICIEKNL